MIKTDSQIDSFDPENIFYFPLPEDGREGLIGYTNDITLQMLYSAYRQSIFPWFNEDEHEPVLWWSPDPRFILKAQDLHTPKSLKKFLKKNPYTYTCDTCFTQVMQNCADMKRTGQTGTWIGNKMIEAYERLHKIGYAHSIEVWNENELVGGFYGILMGQVFCGESMFTKQSESAKSAFIQFAQAFFQCGGKIIDCQVYTDNLARFGAKNISRSAFIRYENDYIDQPLEKDVFATFLTMANAEK